MGAFCRMKEKHLQGANMMKANIGTTYGYVRVSTRDQNEARQLMAMKEFGVR